MKESIEIEEEIFLKIDAVKIHKYKDKDWIGKRKGKMQYKEAN